MSTRSGCSMRNKKKLLISTSPCKGRKRHHAPQNPRTLSRTGLSGSFTKSFLPHINFTKGFPEGFVFVEEGFSIELRASRAACKSPQTSRWLQIANIEEGAPGRVDESLCPPPA